MNAEQALLTVDGIAEIPRLIDTLHATEKRLTQLTLGEVDCVADRHGRFLLLRHAQEQMRFSDAAMQAAIVNALPAHIALVDWEGMIVSVNEAWRGFAREGDLDPAVCSTGCNYLTTCDEAVGRGSADGWEMAAGMRGVLSGRLHTFSMEYPCHSPTEQRWFCATVTPLSERVPTGAVVMHINITDRKLEDIRFRSLSRVHAMLSGINALIVRAGDRDQLFREACTIANEVGGFSMAWIGVVDPTSGALVPIAASGMNYLDLQSLKKLCVSPEDQSLLCRSLRTLLADHQTIVLHNLPQDSTDHFAGDARAAERASLALFALVVSGECRGVLALYARDAEHFHGDELKLLGDLAGDIAFAIGHIEKGEQLNYLTDYDRLTGLANRNLFVSRLNDRLAAASKANIGLAVGVLDLDRFKNLNDSLGRKAGDALLQQIAGWLTARTGDAQRLSRVGGDRFLLVTLEVRDGQHVIARAEESIALLLAHPFQLNDASFQISAKVGLAVFPQDGLDAETLIKNAELALKHAKAGGQRCLFYSPAMAAAMAGQLELERRLHKALERAEFELHYQPKIHLASGALAGAEALIRWNDPERGLVPPSAFIPLMEQTGLIHSVGRWALHTAITDARRWRLAGLGSVRIAVNVSPLQLRSLGFLQELEDAIGGDPLAAASLELEITESLAVEDIKTSIPTLQAIRNMGVSIAIDDFGTGFSSLSYLARLPVDALKIDRSFIIEMTSGPKCLALVSTIITLAHALKLKVVAEGIENEEQSRLLRLLGCDEMQGFLVSKAVPAAVFEAKYLRSQLSVAI